MSLTSGFFDSVNHDRKYNTLQMSSIFDGIIRDGVFMSIADKLMVDAESGMTIVAKPGRAWFNHTWTLNDAKLPLVVEQSELILDRIDAVVLEVNSSQAVRANAIKMVKGTPSADPQKPTLTKSLDVNQYPLAYVSVKHGVTVINQADITNAVGTSECPFVIGILETMDIDALVAQWKSEWELWINEMKENGEDWQNQVESEFEAWSIQQKEEFTQFIQQFEATMQIFQTNSEEAFNKWFETVKDILDDNTAGNLLNLINEIKDGNPNATATYNGKVVSIVSNPTTAKNIYFYAPSNFVETDTYTLNGLPLTITDLNGEPINNAWKAGSPVSLIIKGNIGFFKSGGGGRNDTLPPMVTQLSAAVSNRMITVTYKNPVSDALAGVLITYKKDSYPQHPFDGTKIDAKMSEKAVLNFLDNGIVYYIRVFPYNSKKQYQTLYEGSTIQATPSEGPKQVTNVQVTGTGAAPVISWKNPTDDPTYTETVVVQKEDSPPTSLSDGTEIYRGTGETVSANGLEQLVNYYFGVFTVNAEGGTRGPVVSDVYSYDFPSEPTEWSEVTRITNSTEYTFSEEGWFKIVAVAGSGRGANALEWNRDYRHCFSGGSGGSGGISVSKTSTQMNEKITINISNNEITITELNMVSKPGWNASPGFITGPISGTISAGGRAGSASGGNLENIPGKPGNNGDYRNSSQSIPSYLTPGSPVSTNYDKYSTTSGIGGRWPDGNGSEGTGAYVVILRGNTNEPVPSRASTLSLLPTDSTLTVDWTNSGDPVQTGTMLVYNASHVPKSPSDGIAVDIPLTQPVTLDLNSNNELQENSKKQSYTIKGVPNNKPVFVALFPYDKDRKYGLAKQEVEIPREYSWYDKQQELEAEVETVKAEMVDYRSYYTTTQEVFK